MAASINSLVWATDIDVLERDHTLERREGYWVVQSPRNPTYWWGNFLLFDDAPVAGDGERWERLFEREFRARPDVTHRSLAWDRLDGEIGAAQDEFLARGYALEQSVGLLAAPADLREHPRANAEVEIRPLDPDADEALWAAVIDLQWATAPEEWVHSEYHVNFLRGRQRSLRELFRDGRGAWYVALLGGEVAGSLGLVVTEGRARYQNVDTAEAHRRRGIATRLVHAAAQHALERHAIHHFAIVADPDYHAVGIYEGLGFRRVELTAGVLRKPDRS